MQSSGSRAAQHALENENKPQKEFEHVRESMGLAISMNKTEVLDTVLSDFSEGYYSLCYENRRTLLLVLAKEFDLNRTQVRELIKQYLGVDFCAYCEEAQLAGAEEVGGYPAAFYRIGWNLRHALKPMYESLFERLNMHPGGLKFLSSLRADILYILRAVHPISNLIDLKRRLGVGRRCFGYLHPAIPGEPLIFIEVVLLKNVAQTIPCALILSRALPELIVTEVIVYAVHMSNISFSVVICPKGRPGLAGINLGKFLIKRVITLVKRGMPQISTYATLSLVPGYIQWLISKLASQSKLAEVEDISQSSDDDWEDKLDGRSIRKRSQSKCWYHGELCVQAIFF
ncbi:hypothetical protein Patl1_09937 [Pistacia atlantica]|uniref:Uncharacterized protein n=1 Tax=Pistacia atlantica TaxID=434234 RepID=A0ACC1A5R4_9ROSI|nr:hypothetical protein Patl1_09937 [Pistacia atlantica]